MRISIALPFLLLLAASLRAAGSRTLAWTFDSDPVGRVPASAEVYAGRWAVRAQTDAPSPPHVLCQTGIAEFPAIVFGDTVFENVALAVRLKPVSGRIDRAGGLIFRVHDSNNYYILRVNALENNANIYKYAVGHRSLLKEARVPVRSGQWHTLRTEVTGNQIRGFFDGRLVVEAADSTFMIGKVGLWTKADSVTCFDNLEASGR